MLEYSNEYKLNFSLFYICISILKTFYPMGFWDFGLWEFGLELDNIGLI